MLLFYRLDHFIYSCGCEVVKYLQFNEYVLSFMLTAWSRPIHQHTLEFLWYNSGFVLFWVPPTCYDFLVCSIGTLDDMIKSGWAT